MNMQINRLAFHWKMVIGLKINAFTTTVLKAVKHWIFSFEKVYFLQETFFSEFLRSWKYSYNGNETYW